ncbi:MAG: S-layer homology domain-containing protein, partial [Clostridia bacterium]|nr:S-layer homology domain-containing protein [Clostridia bacterium]
LGINCSVTSGDTKIPVTYINKWLQDDFDNVYLLTPDFSTTTHTAFKALYVICSPLSGRLAVNETMELKVDEVFIYDGAIKIPAGKLVFVMDADGDPEALDMLSRLAPGNILTVANSVYGAERYDWSQAEFAVSSIGGRLINNGITGSGFEAGTAPRTAVGITADGKVIFYTLDGRQKGYSYGCRIETLAARMRELGCVDAINLDGGGSTTIGGIFPGSSVFEVTNRPSDGALRMCANFLFLQDNRKKTDDPWYIEWSLPKNHNYLAGTSLSLIPTSVYDTGNYKMDGLRNVDFTVSNTGEAETEVDNTGFVNFKGTGHSQVIVSGNSYYKEFGFEVYETPDEIRIINESTGKATESLSVNEGKMTSVNLEAAAYVNGIRLEAYPSLYLWETEGTLASVDEDGNVSIKDDGSESAILRVRVGEAVKEIPITVTETDTFADISGHWAHDIIEEMSDNGIVNGINENGTLLFKPDADVSRIQFAAIVSNVLGLDVSEYSGARLNFTDNASIQPWAVNYIKAMVSLGYINGKSDDDGRTFYFDPESSITRAEAFAVMARAIPGNDRAELGFADSSDIPSWAVGSFEKLLALGMIRGFSDNTIKPGAKTTRAEAVSLAAKLLE